MLRERLERKHSFQAEGHENELKNNESIVIVEDKGQHFIDLILEPDKLERLSSECRLTQEEYVDAIERFLDSEGSDWKELRMKDQVNLTRDEIIKDTMLKFVKEKHNIDRKDFNGIEVSYNKRYDKDGSYIGEAIILSMHRS